mmetsp:Transcript_20721/g.33403  ORF Transcript_20721/g.33403 Transcript_20721/m.33403 type:complete len:364 (-) Transcript_20721:187-1278(-)
MDHTQLNAFIDLPSRPASRGYGFTQSHHRSPLATAAQHSIRGRGNTGVFLGPKPDRFAPPARVIQTSNDGTQWHSYDYRHSRVDKINNTLENARLKPRPADLHAMAKLKCKGGKEEPGTLSYTRPQFRCGRHYDPEIAPKKSDLPSDIMQKLESGSLVSPAMRRKAMKAERDMQHARKELRRRQFEVDRRQGYMKRHHKEGVLQLDKPDFNDSQIFNEQSKINENYMKTRSIQSSMRSQNIVSNAKTYSFKGDAAVTQGGNRFFGADEQDEVSRRETALLQKRARNAPKLDTHDRLFGSPPIKDQTERKRRLRNIETRGRSVDPIFHKKIEIDPPTVKFAERPFLISHKNQTFSDDIPDIYPH